MSRRIGMAPLGELVRQEPARSQVLARFGIDYCCRGRTPLADACRNSHLDLDQVCHELDAPATSLSAEERTDWSTRPLQELIDHIQSIHHAYLRREFPRLQSLLESLGTTARERPELSDLRGLLDALDAELMQHMRKEEMVLFPWIGELERRQISSSFNCGSVTQPVAVMEHEHRFAAEALDRMRWLTRDYQTEAGFAPSHRVFLEGLADLDADLRLHIHEENNILFPRAVQLESALKAESRARPSHV